MSFPLPASAIQAWGDALGRDAVSTHPDRLQTLQQNVSGLSHRIAATLEPDSTEAVQRVIAIANQYRVPVYPVSRGRNWGMGSYLPVRDGCVLLDLHRMDRIHEINDEFGYAVIEPGVTQGQLYERLRDRHPSWYFNVTGSSSETSIVGNWLERGVGYFRSRADEGSGLEVVLGNGQVFHTGFGHLPQATTAHLYRFGVGPSLDHLFAQSNFGVVTRMGISLLHRDAATAAVLCSVATDDGFEALVDTLGEFRRRGWIRWVAHVGNQGRSDSTLEPLAREYLLAREVPEDQLAEQTLRFVRKESFVGWSAVCGFSGSLHEVRFAVRSLRRRLGRIARVRLLTAQKIDLLEKITGLLAFSESMRRKRALIPSIRQLYGLALGIPTKETLKGVFWGVKETPPVDDWDPNHHPRCGWLYCLPMIPLRGRDARRASDLAESVLGGFGFPPLITFNLVDHRILEGVINVAFDRSQPDQVSRAHEAVHALRAEYAKLGWYPYRLGIHEMERFIDPADPYWQTIQDLKQVFDPNHIIAPGRYNLA